jgi:GntR family transcriptional regulator/MocR family aminotransferase
MSKETSIYSPWPSSEFAHESEMKIEQIVLQRDSEVPMHRQLYEALTEMIVNGSLKAGDKLPPARDFAKLMGVSRPTIETCLFQLAQEGYVETRRSSGTYVSPNLSDVPLSTLKSTPGKHRKASSYSLSDYGRFVSQMPHPVKAGEEPEISFYCWRPALDQFPLTEWARAIGRHARASSVAMLDTNMDAQGSIELRQALVGLVKKFRGVECHPDQIIPVFGLNQGLDLVARMHLSPGSNVVVEDPGFPPSIMKALGAKITAVAVDEFGLRTDLLPAADLKADIAYVTPTRQFPKGGVLTLSRRLELLEWAKLNDTIIIEDDYDSEYHGTSRPIPALMTLDKEQRVIYLGTLNQLMFPSLALGYLIVPLQLVPAYRQARALMSEQLSPPVQAAVVDFINEGHLERHVKRLRVLYKSRRGVLVEELKRRFGERVSIGPDKNGVFVLVEFNLDFSETEILSRASRAGVGLTSTRGFYLSKSKKTEFIMGIGSLSEDEIRKGIRKLARALA